MAVCTICGSSLLSSNSEDLLASLNSNHYELSFPSPVEDLKTIDTEIRRAEALIVQLNERRNILKAHRNLLKSAILRLPTDITQEIMMAACTPPPLQQLEIDPIFRPVFTPLLFGKICREWRQIAWSTPRIWSCVSLELSVQRYHSQAALFEEWLGRTKSSPLTIKVAFAGPKSLNRRLWNTHPPHEIFRVLAEYAETWEHVEFALPRTCRSDLSRIQTLPILKSLTVSHTERSYPMEDPLMFLDAPELRQANLELFARFPIYLPWSQLKHIKATSISPSQFWTVFQSISSAITCQMYDVMLSSDVPVPTGGMVTHPLLETLIIGARSPHDNLLAVLDFITLPALTVLEIKCPTAPLLPLKTFVKRSSCHLKELALKDASFHEDELIELIREIPSLRKLQIHFNVFPESDNNGFTPAFWSGLAPGAECIAPSLEEIEFKGYAYFDGHCVADIIQRRWGPLPAGIHTVVIGTHNHVEWATNLQDELQQLPGMHYVSVTTTSLTD